MLAGQGIRILTVWGWITLYAGGRNRQVYADNLVQSGLFEHCRNPLYLGNLLLIIGFGVMANNLWYLTVTYAGLFPGVRLYYCCGRTLPRRAFRVKHIGSIAPGRRACCHV
ncbi:methyltransferase family protein [Citrobacter enshiensis]|uniref:methyltransferase family protein n=1 Tax=Citrobacter enshiensis TaxID=2971264 RepID=UPI0023E86EB9|nr:methyltransferase [Citrobacter enshiensis]WET42322.1 methyltransferase [Citrobacter enshiensis]